MLCIEYRLPQGCALRNATIFCPTCLTLDLGTLSVVSNSLRAYYVMVVIVVMLIDCKIAMKQVHLTSDCELE